MGPLIDKKELERRIAEDLDNLKILVRNNFREIIYRKWGVYSMTGNPNNVLMWSYYCRHEGFCIEFDITQFPFKFYGPFPINYQSELKSLSIKEIGVQLGVLIQCNLKDEIWKHEDEWRLMILSPDKEDMLSPHFDELKKLGGHDRKFNYLISAIRSIALGNRFFEPEEIYEVNKTELEINLKDNVEKKASVLNFIADNDILTHIGLRSGFTKIVFRTTNIERKEGGQYKITSI